MRKLARYLVTELLSPKPGVKGKEFSPEISIHSDSVHLPESLCQSLRNHFKTPQESRTIHIEGAAGKKAAPQFMESSTSLHPAPYSPHNSIP